MVLRLSLVLLVAFLLALCPVSLAAKTKQPKDPELLELIDSILEAHGGRRALEAVRSLKVKGRLKASRQKETGQSTVYFEYPDRLLSEHRFGRSREVRILNGTRGWIGSDGDIRPAGPSTLLGMRFSLIAYRLPLELSRRLNDINYLGLIEHREGSFQVLELSDSANLRLRIFVDQKTRLIAQVVGFITSGGRTVVLARRLEDYRKVSGLLYPFHQAYFSGQRLLAEKWVEKLEVNPRLPESLFLPSKTTK